MIVAINEISSLVSLALLHATCATLMGPDLPNVGAVQSAPPASITSLSLHTLYVPVHQQFRLISKAISRSRRDGIRDLSPSGTHKHAIKEEHILPSCSVSGELTTRTELF